MSKSSQAFPAAGSEERLGHATLGWWCGHENEAAEGSGALREALHEPRKPIYVITGRAGLAVAREGSVFIGPAGAPPAPAFSRREALPLVGFAPPLLPEMLGDPSFRADHGLRYAYMTGSMANGIASVELVAAIRRAGMLASYGAAGLSPREIEAAIDRLESVAGRPAPCFNIIHSPSEPELEAAVVDLYLRRGVRLVEASAYLDLTPQVVRYRVQGIHRGEDGRAVAPNRIIAKASRVEVAARWFSPPPARILGGLVASGLITRAEAELAGEVPMAQDLTAEADSGGHTDNRPAITLLPTLLALRDRIAAERGYPLPLRVGAAGGIATPASAAAAFAMGAAYVVTGSINQACVESGSSDVVRKMLAEAEQADVAMAPAADMFEMGIKLQVLKRGTMFAMRAQKLYEIYRSHGSLDELSDRERQSLEKTVFRLSLDEVWQQTRTFFLERDPGQVERANRDPKHKMALVCRWYLGLSSRWANHGEPSRQADYQVWCGPAMGAFNEWVRGSFLAEPAERRVTTVAMNILFGAAVLTRTHVLRSQGVKLPPESLRVEPLRLHEIEERLH